ncbi:MAG TPA: NADP-dependent malic enzyme [Patescibacteria group bacterium]|nr:NADP-dependent malic enzyme [Patescibacteria group bacterium]
MSIKDPIEYHRQLHGKITVISKQKLDKENLGLAYTPGVGEASKAIAADKGAVYELTGKQNMVAIVTDGTAVLGLGNIGPEAALPVMEGKAAIFADFAKVNAIPICLDTQDTEEIIKTVKNIAPAFGGINLEDIAAPRCFEIEKRLSEELDIPVFHDDQHGTAIVVLAGLINALKVTGKDKTVKIVISGAGAAGLSIANLLAAYGLTNYCICDSKGVISRDRTDVDDYKKLAVSKSTADCPAGKSSDALKGADVLIGVSKPGQFTAADIKTMNKDAIVFALANPIPEIMPEEAYAGGAKIVATGRSDFPNQVNNALVFPGLFRGLLDNRTVKVTAELKIAIAEAIAGIVKQPTAANIIPSIFEHEVVSTIAATVANY